MKTFGALLAVILFASSPVLGQADNPNAELDLWREAMADYNRRSEEVRQQYAADRELWRTHVEEATRPLSTGKKILKGLAYAADKTLTGVVNYYSNRAAIRSEMGRFDSRFESLRDGIQASRADILGANEPQWSLQNRPTMVTSKPANGDGPGRCCSTSLGLDSASPF